MIEPICTSPTKHLYLVFLCNFAVCYALYNFCQSGNWKYFTFILICIWLSISAIEFNIKMWVQPKVTCTFSAIIIKIPESIFVDIKRLILKFMWKGKLEKHPSKNLNSGKKRTCQGFTLSNFKTCYKATYVKPVWCWPKVRHTVHWTELRVQNRATQINRLLIVN